MRAERMTNLSTLAIAVLAISLPLFCQPGVTPVPANWLNDGQLVVPELNFSINSPTPYAKWSYTGDLPKADGKGSITFVVALGDGSKFVVSVRENSSKMTSTSGDQFFIGMKKGLAKDWEMKDGRYEVSDVPLKDSRKFKVTIVQPNGYTYTSYGYIVSGNTSYQMVTASLSQTEPAPFTKFVQSFTLLKPTANAPLP